MAWNLDDHRPIYIQIVEEIQLRIVTGIYKPGEKIPSVRELASEASVNPNTMQKAFAELEHSGLILTQRTSGRTVCEDSSLIQQIKESMAQEEITLFLERMSQLGYNTDDTISLVNKKLGGVNS